MSAAKEDQLRQRLWQVLPTWLSLHGPDREVLRRLLDSNVPLGMMADIAGIGLPLPIAVKQELLEQTNVELRLARLLQYLETNPPPELLGPPSDRKFPPDFSSN